MKQIHRSHKEICDTEKQEIFVIKEMAGIPGKNKYAAGNDDAEQFSKTVEEQITVKACQVKYA